eukprot:2429125-Rhodomonas_salina.1
MQATSPYDVSPYGAKSQKRFSKPSKLTKPKRTWSGPKSITPKATPSQPKRHNTDSNLLAVQNDDANLLKSKSEMSSLTSQEKGGSDIKPVDRRWKSEQWLITAPAAKPAIDPEPKPLYANPASIPLSHVLSPSSCASSPRVRDEAENQTAENNSQIITSPSEISSHQVVFPALSGGADGLWRSLPSHPRESERDAHPLTAEGARASKVEVTVFSPPLNSLFPPPRGDARGAAWASPPTAGGRSQRGGQGSEEEKWRERAAEFEKKWRGEREEAALRRKLTELQEERTMSKEQE